MNSTGSSLTNIGPGTRTRFVKARSRASLKGRPGCPPRFRHSLAHGRSTCPTSASIAARFGPFGGSNWDRGAQRACH